MAKLNQIIAIEKGIKNKASQELTAFYHQVQKAPLLQGIQKTYQPQEEDGETLPSEGTLVQVKALPALKEVAKVFSELMDVTATKDYANCEAFADVKVGDKVLLSKVPVSHLLFLEKQLADWHTVIKKLPLHDPSETWTYNETTQTWTSEPKETTRTKKVPRAFVKAEATEKHPAQVEVFHEDVRVGTWRTVKFTGAVSPAEVADMLERVETLQKAVQFAREEANGQEVVQRKEGAIVFDYVFGK